MDDSSLFGLEAALCGTPVIPAPTNGKKKRGKRKKGPLDTNEGGGGEVRPRNGDFFSEYKF